MKRNVLTLAVAILAVLKTTNVLAFELPAGSVVTGEVLQAQGSASFPIGVFSDGSVPMQYAEGSIVSQAWKIPSNTQTTLQMIAPMRQKLVEDGYQIILDCETDECGGYDFRFKINLLPEPDMHVDLGDFRFISARHADLGFVSLVVSRGGSTGFIQISSAVDESNQPVVVNKTSNLLEQSQVANSTSNGSIADLLISVGRAPLEDLSFVTGSSRLGSDDFASLAELAAFLKTNPGKSVALVGHTDAEGSLANNLALSKKRAQSVVQRLVLAHSVPRRQLEAAGVGYLVPRASNLTDAGRTKNRRVEVILNTVAP